MVRRLVSGEQNQRLVSQVINLAQSILDEQRSPNIWRITQQNAREIPCDTSRFGRYIEYTDVESCHAACFFYHSRNVICGTICRLLEEMSHLDILTEYFHFDKIHFEEMKSAEHVAMSVEYALRPRSGPPLCGLRLSTSLGVSFATWSRLAKYDQTAFLHTQEQAMGMQDFICDTMNQIALDWKRPPWSREYIFALSIAYTGGPPLGKSSLVTSQVRNETAL